MGNEKISRPLQSSKKLVNRLKNENKKLRLVLQSIKTRLSYWACLNCEGTGTSPVSSVHGEISMYSACSFCGGDGKNAMAIAIIREINDGK